jgi:hypothetical protein
MAVTVTTEQTVSSVKKIVFNWATTGTTGGTTINTYDGEVISVVCTNTATTGGTIILTDNDGNDILMGKGVLSTGISYAGTTDGRYPIGAVANSKLTCTVASTGAAGTGYCYVKIR